jgi:hypothetical protein
VEPRFSTWSRWWLLGRPLHRSMPVMAHASHSFCAVVMYFLQTHGSLCKRQLLCTIEHGTCLSYCYCTCDLNILGTRMEPSFSLSQNGVWQPATSLPDWPPSSTVSLVRHRWTPPPLLRRYGQGLPVSHSSPRCLNRVPHDAVLPYPSFWPTLPIVGAKIPAGHHRPCFRRRPSSAFVWAAPAPDSMWATRHHRFRGLCPVLCQ